MQIKYRKTNRYLVAALIVSCLFGGLFPFLNIDLRVIILTPVRTALLLVSLYCLILWVLRLWKGQAFAILGTQKMQWTVFAFFVIWSISGIAWLLLGNTNDLAPTEVMGIVVTCIFAFCVFTLVETKEDLFFLLRVCVASGVILALMAMVEVVTGSFVENTKYYYTLEERIALGQTLFSPTTVFYNPNDFAAYILLCIAIVCFWIVQAKNKREFFGSLLIAGILAVPTFLTNSTLFNLTSGLLMILTAISILFTRCGPMRDRIAKSLTIVVLVAFFAFAVSDAIRSVAVHLNKLYFSEKISVYQESLPTPDSDADTDVSTDPSDIAVTGPSQMIGTSDVEQPDSLAHQIESAKYGRGTIHTRLWLIRAGWVFFLENPLIGCGPGAYRDEMASHSELLEQTGGIVDPHFFYIELLSQYGVILFVVYVAILLYMVIRLLLDAIRELRTGCPGRGILCLFLLAAFSVAVIMPSTVIRHTALWVFYLLTVSAFSKMGTQEENAK